MEDSTSEILLNNELTKITDWLSSNKLSLNVKKTKFMVFHTPLRRVNYPALKLNNVLIERVSQFNFLDIILSSSLKWDKHVAHVSLKISRVIGVLHRLKFYYKLTKKELPPYFDIMLPTLPNVCDYYNIRRPAFHLPFIKHSFAEQRLDYQLIKILNVHGSILLRKVQHLFFYAFKTFVKYKILNNYVDRCYEANCVTCHIVAQR